MEPLRGDQEVNKNASCDGVQRNTKDLTLAKESSFANWSETKPGRQFTRRGTGEPSLVKPKRLQKGYNTNTQP